MCANCTPDKITTFIVRQKFKRTLYCSSTSTFYTERLESDCSLVMGGACKEFPIEIIHNILGFIHSTKDLIQCQIANKYWSYLTQKLIYTTITLNSIQATYAYIETVKTSTKKLGLFAHTICLNYPISDTMDHEINDILKQLALHCPNLKSLQVLYPPDHDRWFTFLTNMNNELKLECISPSNVWGRSPRYASAVCKFAPSLTHLTVQQHNDLFLGDGTKHYDKILASKLPRLNTLEIIMDEGRTISSYDEFVQVCPALTTIRCLHRSQFWNAAYDDINVMPYHKETKIDLSLIQPRPEIKACEGTLVMNCGESVLYFMHKFPQLEKLDICIDCDFEYKEASDFNFTHDTMLSFLIYISKIPNFCVTGISLPNAIDVLVSFMEATHYDGFIGIEYQETSDESYKLWTSSNPKFSFENYHPKHGVLEQKITVIFPMYVDEEDQCSSIEKEVYLPHLKMLDQMHGLTEKLCLGESYGERSSQGYEILNRMAEWMGIEPDYDVHSLNEIFKSCSSLETLHLDLLQLMECEPSECEGVCETLHTLELTRSNLSVNILPQLSTRLPALKFLNMTKCTMISETNNNFKIHLPDSSLHVISCIDPVIYDLKSTEFYMKLKTENRSEQFYKSDGPLLNTCSSRDYKNSLNSAEIVSFDIQCKSVDCLHFKIGKQSKREFTL